MIREDIQVIVISNPHRRPLILDDPLFANVEHTLHVSTDYDLPPDFKPDQQHVGLVLNHTGHLRCNRAHQEAMAKLTKPVGLMFEDDTGITAENWHDIVNKAAGLLDTYEAVSLHGRQWFPRDFESRPFLGVHQLMVPNKKRFWCVGANAYMVKLETVPRMSTIPYDGEPLDCFMHNRFTFALIDPSPFVHDRRQKSLIET